MQRLGRLIPGIMSSRNTGALFTHFLLSWLKPQFVCFSSTCICSVAQSFQPRFPGKFTDSISKSHSGQTSRTMSACSRFFVPIKTGKSIRHYQRNSTDLSNPLRQTFCKFCYSIPTRMVVCELFSLSQQALYCVNCFTVSQ
jgi:hypothetical protein